MRLWYKIINWFGISTFEKEVLIEEKFIINPRREKDIWSKNKYKIN